MSRRVALLADEMGLGKTAQALISLSRLRARGLVSKALIVIPQYLRTNWEREICRFAPSSPAIAVFGTRAEREAAWKAGWPVIFIAGYETVVADSDLLSHRNWDLLIIDEIQRLKNSDTTAHGSVARLHTLRRWGLTGTPIENTFQDLMSIFAILWPDRITRDFVARPEEARQILLDHVLRRRLSEVVDLPPLIQDVAYVDLSVPQRLAYERVRKWGADRTKAGGSGKVKRSDTPHTSLATQSELLRIASIDDVSGASSKLQYLQRALSGLPPQEKTIVFSCYPNKVLRQIAPHLREFEPVFLDGSQTAIERDRVVDAFQHRAESRLALISLKAGGVGLNLTAASRIFHFDSWWTAAARQQANARAHRIGQKRTVFATSLVAAGTLEEAMLRIMQDKGRLADVVLSRDGVGEDDIESKLLEGSMSDE
jgi:SNF2 family DNA or RNA helicase